MSYDGGERERQGERGACWMDSMSRRIAQTSTLKISPQEGTRRAHESLALLPQEDGQNDCVKDWEANNATYGLALGSISIIIEVRSPGMSTCCQLVKEVSERKWEGRESGVTMK